MKPLVAAAAFVLFAGAAMPAIAGQPPSPAPAARDAEFDEQRIAPVLLSGEPILWIGAGIGPYTTEARAARIGERLRDIVRDRTLRQTPVTITEVSGTSELRVGAKLVMIVTPRDAERFGAPRIALAQQYVGALEDAIRLERERYTPATLMRSAGFAALATAVFALVIWLILKVTRLLRRAVRRRLALRSATLRAMQAELLPAARVGRTTTIVMTVMRIGLIALALQFYLSYVLGLFPWTRAISRTLIGYVLTPVRTIALAVAGYLPKALFLAAIVGAVYVAFRIVGAFFHQIQIGRLVFSNFPAEWADPTNKIVRTLLVGFGLVVAFPYLPASDSPAFTGVSVFFGVLVSLASSSALANMIAGVVLTYTSAFRVGDRVKLGDAFGDIIETSLLATRIRTIKNEEITIPNSIALGTAVTNYTREAAARGLILHTTVTIGYNVPWRKIHDLLVEAALATPGILAEPRPFVWQTALNDFYVSYEINAYTAAPAQMIDIYAALHAAIQDAFFAAGVEIMSPHYTSVRDGNTAAIPAAFRPADYEAPAFRVAAHLGVPVTGGENPKIT
jgi:small-conductance mechanosensitive channel